MISIATHDLLELLTRGNLSPASAEGFEKLSAQSFVDDLTINFPFIFQKRIIGRKHEIAMSREVVYEFRFRKPRSSPFYGVHLYPVLNRCFLVSFYDDELSEITWAKKINLRPKRADAQNQLVLSFDAGFKADKTIDGWVVKPLLRRRVILSESSLQKSGFQFDVLPPFGLRSFCATP